MNPIFLEKYHHELKFFRDASKEFAKEHPGVAGHLGLLAPEIEDPYVERLIEAVSFLTARINFKIEEKYPQFLEHIFKVIHPNFTRIIPSATIISVTRNEPKPITIPQGTSIFTHAKKQGGTICQFSTCHHTQITPILIQKTTYNRITQGNGQGTNKALLNILMRIPQNLEFDNIDFEKLYFYIQNCDYYTGTELLYHLLQKNKNLIVKSGNFKSSYSSKINLSGFDFDLDIYGDRRIDYLKNLTEYSILPEKYLFFQIADLKKIISDCITFNKNNNKNNQSDFFELEVSIYFSDISNNLEKYLNKSFLSLNSLIITNAFLKKTRFTLNTNSNEQLVVMDKVRAKDFEIIGIKSVEGFNADNHKVSSFSSIYKTDNHYATEDTKKTGFYSDSYKPSYQASTTNSYKGNDCYLAISGQYSHIKNEHLNQLAIEAWCSNRGLIKDIVWTIDKDLVFDDRYKIHHIARQCRFTEPLNAPICTIESHRLMNLISSNFIANQIADSHSLTNQIKNSLLTIYEIAKNEAFKSQIDAITLIQAKFISQTLKQRNKLLPISGLHFDIILDESLMSHSHPYIWGKILLSYLKGFSPINQFTKLTLRNANQEIIANFDTLEE